MSEEKEMRTTTAADRGSDMTGDPRSEFADLIARLEKATGPDRQIGNDCLFHGGWKVGEEGDGPDRATYWVAPDGTEYLDGDHPDPTASIDAALTLVPEGHGWNVSYLGDAAVFRLSDFIVVGSYDVDRDGSKPAAIALCIAALEALAAVEPRQAASTPQSVQRGSPSLKPTGAKP